jgi:hypothetical protein
MSVRFLAVCASAALALPALAQAQPSRFRLETTIAPGQSAVLTIGKVPRGEFGFSLRASSDGDKRLVLTQRRGDGTSFTVLGVPSPAADSVCEGAAGSLYCGMITTPASPGGHTWSFRLRNRSGRPMSIALTITWRKVTSAG